MVVVVVGEVREYQLWIASKDRMVHCIIQKEYQMTEDVKNSSIRLQWSDNLSEHCRFSVS